MTVRSVFCYISSSIIHIWSMNLMSRTVGIRQDVLWIFGHTFKWNYVLISLSLHIRLIYNRFSTAKIFSWNHDPQWLKNYNVWFLAQTNCFTSPQYIINIYPGYIISVAYLLYAFFLLSFFFLSFFLLSFFLSLSDTIGLHFMNHQGPQFQVKIFFTVLFKE